MSEHGFLRPNPALLDLEDRIKKKKQLAHELGEGAACTKCGSKCPGFQLHFWRKVCTNCRCGKAEHNVQDLHDPGFYFVGKILDRPLRSKEEEMEFCFGDQSSDEESRTNDQGKKKGVKAGRMVKFDWIPPNISKALARRYMEEIPESSLPIAGTEGAFHRKQQLEKQFPVHDIEPKECHDLSAGEVKSMEDYIANVKEHIVGQGEVMELDLEDLFPPPPSQEFLDQLSGQMGQLNTGDLNPTSPGGTLVAAKSYNPQLLAGPKPYGSTSSSLSSSRNATPSPTSGSEEHHHLGHGEIPKLSRPSRFGGGPGAAAQISPLGHHSSTHHPGHSSSHQVQAEINPRSPGGSASCASIAAGLSSNRPSAPGTTTCMGCSLTLKPGDVAVKAERAGPGKLWHPQCFKCHTCEEILVDLLYYYESGHVYCARDYAAKAKIPRCSACDELIFAVEYTGAENQFWHLKHFCCYECDRPLAGHKYIAVDRQPHCLLCYQSKHGKVCTTCGEYIDPQDQRVSLDGQHWHSKDSCFCCGICATPLLGRKMTKKCGLVLCSSACSKKAMENHQSQELPYKGPQISSSSTLV